MTQKWYVARNTEIAARRLGDEMMVISSRTSTLFTLNELAVVIWESASGSASLDEIVQRDICPRFDVDPGVALRDATCLAQGLAAHGILLLAETPFHSSSPGLAPR
jgi:hypothetical protein